MSAGVPALSGKGILCITHTHTHRQGQRREQRHRHRHTHTQREKERKREMERGRGEKAACLTLSHFQQDNLALQVQDKAHRMTMDAGGSPSEQL